MRYVKITDVNDLPEQLKNVISVQVVDGNIEAVEVKVDNQMVRIVKIGDYSNALKMLVQQPMKEIVKYIVSGNVSDITIADKEFDNEQDAQHFIDQKKTDFYCNTVELIITKKSVFVEETKV